MALAACRRPFGFAGLAGKEPHTGAEGEKSQDDAQSSLRCSHDAHPFPKWRQNPPVRQRRKRHVREIERTPLQRRAEPRERPGGSAHGVPPGDADDRVGMHLAWRHVPGCLRGSARRRNGEPSRVSGRVNALGVPHGALAEASLLAAASRTRLLTELGSPLQRRAEPRERPGGAPTACPSHGAPWRRHLLRAASRTRLLTELGSPLQRRAEPRERPGGKRPRCVPVHGDLRGGVTCCVRRHVSGQPPARSPARPFEPSRDGACRFRAAPWPFAPSRDGRSAGCAVALVGGEDSAVKGVAPTAASALGTTVRSTSRPPAWIAAARAATAWAAATAAAGLGAAAGWAAAALELAAGGATGEVCAAGLVLGAGAAAARVLDAGVAAAAAWAASAAALPAPAAATISSSGSLDRSPPRPRSSPAATASVRARAWTTSGSMQRVVLLLLRQRPAPRCHVVCPRCGDVLAEEVLPDETGLPGQPAIRRYRPCRARPPAAACRRRIADRASWPPGRLPVPGCRA